MSFHHNPSYEYFWNILLFCFHVDFFQHRPVVGSTKAAKNCQSVSGLFTAIAFLRKTNFFTFLALSYSNPIHFALAANSTCDVTLIIINGCKNPSSGPVFLGPAPIFVHLCPEQRSVPLLSPHLRHHQPRPLRQVLFHAFEDYLILTFLVAWLSIATS